ncbi:MAG: tRNA pseudouridine(38-40) synthase TruA [Candidatus Kapabacteria bacterium]|nr:tRNA pseudouridine(38-40) synthase TruA [Candidatus Kapabacteria bacterium]
MYLIFEIEYDGTNYSGWQRQKNAITIQGEIERAFREITGREISLTGAGRTDAGVHARAQIAHTEIGDELGIAAGQLPLALNSKLNYDIRIKRIVFSVEKFHARFDAIAREYSYTIVTRYSVFDRHFCTHIRYPIDIDLLLQSAELFLVKDDFTTFSKRNSDIINNVCDVTVSKWDVVDENTLKYTVRANHFLYGMVRSLVGTMLDISRGKRDAAEIATALSCRDRSLQSPLVDARGLILEKIFYKNNLI